MEIIKAINGVFWGWLIAGILLSCGIFYTLRLGFPQIRYFTQLVSNLWKASRDTSGVSAFGALCSAIGSQVGAGSLVGVATALASGGPGAIFWMWVTAILGMPIMFGEAVLAQIFRVKNEDGTTFRGGPAYYIDPYGNFLTAPVWDREELIVADLDLNQAAAAKMEFDPCGHYARPDVLSLHMSED